MTQQPAPPSPPAAPQTPAPAQTAGQDRFLLAIVGGTLLLVAISVVLVFVFGRGRPASPADPSSPAGVVQAYIEAVRDGDADKARSYLTGRGLDDFNRQTYTTPLHSLGDDHIRIVVETTSVTETSAEVKVTISHFYSRPSPFSTGTYHRDIVARLVRENGVWKISQPPQPYELT